MQLRDETLQYRGKVFVISAPSGAGKTTLNRRLVQEHSQLEFTVSYTARARRENEVDGVDYHFVTEENFRQRVDRGEMLEWAEVFGDLKGSSIQELKRITGKGHIPLLEIDVQGWMNARKLLPEAVAIFILPPTAKALWERLEKRGTESIEVRWRRLCTAKKEIEQAVHYHEFVINSDLEEAYTDLRAVVQGQDTKHRSEIGRQHCHKLLEEFRTAPWFQELQAKMSDPA